MTTFSRPGIGDKRRPAASSAVADRSTWRCHASGSAASWKPRHYSLLANPAACGADLPDHRQRLTRVLAVLLLALLLLLLPAVASPAQDQDEPAEGAGPKVAGIDIHGAKAVSEPSIRDVMQLKSSVWWKPKTWFAKRPRFSQERLSADLDSIRDLYQAEGYYSARITPEVSASGPEAVDITISIEEGPRTTVQQVNLKVQGEEPEKWRQRLAPLIVLAPGEPFTASAYNRSKANLADRLLDEGYPKAEVTGEGVVVRSLNQATVDLSVNTGPRGWFGQTSVSGLKVYEEKYIRDELTYRAGQLFDQRRLETSQRRIYNLDLFSTVLVRPMTQKMEPDGRVPVEVQVTEGSRYSTRLGIGYGSEDQFRAQAAWTVRGFLGDLRLLTLSAKYSSLVAGLEAGFVQPYFIDRSSNLYDNLELSRNTLEAYSTDSLNNRLLVDRKLSRNWTVYTGHRLELTKLFNVTQPEAVPETTPSDSIISSFEAGATWDTTTDPYNPTKGWQVIGAYEQATAALFSDLQYIRAAAEGRHYRLLWDDVVLALRLRLGTVVPTEDTPEVPIFKRFFTGGTNTVRGYGFQELGRLDAAGKPLGGVSLTEGNIELRFPIYGKVGGVTFVDFGKVSLREFDYSLNGILYTSGVGLRYYTLIGPVRIDWAYKLNTRPHDEPGRWRIHFSIGQAF